MLKKGLKKGHFLGSSKKAQKTRKIDIFEDSV